MIDEIEELFAQYGGEHYGENATQLAHALQCARLSQLAGDPESLVAAALLHDVGQFLDDAGNAAEQLGLDARHEETGAAFLSHAFPPAVTEPVRLHVEAKRYLCTVQPGYADRLSAASRLSLELQGGAMTQDEARAFEREGWFDEAVRLRGYDDAGKQPGLEVPGLASYRSLLERQLDSARS